MRDLIFVSLENWDEVWRRNQFLCSGLAKRFPKAKILFVGLPLDVSYSLRKGKLAELLGKSAFVVPNIANITATRPLKLFPNSIAIGRTLNQWMMKAHIRRAAKRLPIRNPVLWINDHCAAHLVGNMRETSVIYDITDDWEELNQPNEQAKRVSYQDAELGRKANAIIVCSEQLRQRREAKFGRTVHLIPNGVDHQHYTRDIKSPAALPGEAQRWPKPVFGYTGTLHPERLDLSLIEGVASGIQRGSIVLLGPDFLDKASRERMAALKNVIVHAAVPYSQIPDYMSAFDVNIVPHQVTKFTDSLNPIKLWEYLATGKPIVSTRVAGFRDYPQLVRLVDTAEQFLKAIVDSLLEDTSQKEMRRVEARRNSWDSRVTAIVRIIQSISSSNTAN